jgi:cobalt-zinc-cadmium efflux system outer membrane protein
MCEPGMREPGRRTPALFRREYPKGRVRSRWCTGIAACLFGVLSSCVHYNPQPLAPISSERSFRSRSFNDTGLAAFVRSVQPSSNTQWPPDTLDLATASLIAAYFNPSLQVARAQVKTAEAGIVAAGGHPSPSLSAAGGYETSPESPLSIRFELSLPIETARKRSYRILEAAKLADVARIELREVSWHVYSQVRDAWMDHLAATDALTVIRSESQIRIKTVALIEKRVSVGEAARPELDVARVEASRTAVSLRDAEGQVAATLINLGSAIGVPVSALTTVRFVSGDYGSPQPLELLSIARVQQKGLLNRLDIQRSLLEYAATEARLQLEIARQYPDIQLNPGYDFDEGHHKFTFGPAFPVPVWNRNTGPIAEAEAKRSEAEARFLALQSQAIGDMDRSLSVYRTAFGEFEEADRQWSAIQASHERATFRAVQLGEQDQLALNAVRVESVAALHARFTALAKTRTAFSGLEDAVQAPLRNVPWIQPSPDGKRQ